MFAFIEKRKKEKELNECGIYLSDIKDLSGHNRLFICFLKGLMVFLACYGSVIGLISAFNLPYHTTGVPLFFFIISMFVSFLYYNKITFYTGYILILVLFTRELVRYYLYANSGYQAIINVIYSDYSDYFKLLSVREAQEYYDNRYVTVSVALLFVGVFMALLLNVTISGYMNLLETMLLTLPLVEIAFYIGKKPSLLCIVCLLTSYVAIGVLQASKHSRMQVKGRHTKEFLQTRFRQKYRYAYQANGFGTLYAIVFAALFSGIVLIFAAPSYNTELPETSNPIRRQTDDYIKTFIQAGFSSLFDRYEAKGGLSNGQLGGIGTVRPDFETDLVVTFAPYSYNTVYLKSFTGSSYQNNMWFDSAFQKSSDNETPYSVFLTAEEIAAYDTKLLPPSSSFGKMQIELADLDADSLYLPYYSDLTTENSFSEETKMQIDYSPVLTDDYSPRNLSLTEDYETYINETCLAVPDALKSELASLCVEEHFPGITHAELTSQVGNETEYSNVNEYRLAVAQEIKEMFVEDYPYTMSPGATPYSTDFIEYFLFTQKRGYCAHFASSGVMLLRTMGVPARYVEGYCMPLSLLSESQPLGDENYNDWYTGPSLINEKGVVSVQVNDSYAHAWIEIYLEDYGWIPFEMTPPSFETETGIDPSVFSSLFNNFFGMTLDTPTSLVDNNSSDDAPNIELSNFNVSFTGLTKPLIYMLSGVICIIILLILLRICYRKYLWIRYRKQKNYRALADLCFADLIQVLKRKKLLSGDNPLPQDVMTSLQTTIICNDSFPSVEEFISQMEKALYSENSLSEEEAVLFLDAYRECLRLLK